MEMTLPKLSTIFILLSFGYAYGQDQVCSNGDLRLIIPRNATKTVCTVEQPTELQLCVNQRWCTVCARDWNRRLSRTTCRQLGYSKGYQLPVDQNGEEELPAAAVRVDCSDQENLSECSISRKGSCPIRNIIHLNCTNDDISTTQRCNEGDLRLTGGEMANQGNLEVCHLDVWGSVCNTEWSEANSNVACKELGFTAGMDTENKANLRMIDECTSPIHLYNVTCSGEEDNIVDCPYNSTAPSFSYYNRTCGIVLTCSSACEDGDVDLYILDPRAPEQGWLLICFDEEWRTLCDTQWDFLDSTVACRQLGYIGGFHVELPLAGTPKDVYDIHADNVRCTGNESRLLECQHSTEHNCIHSRDVFLICRESGDGCDNGDVRLVDGPSDREGRLEFCWNDIWGTVCNKDWIRRNTNVTCQQLDLYTGYEESMQLQPTHNIPTVIEQTNCMGSEQQLADCAFQFSAAYNCPLHANDVVLTCLGEEELSDCEDGDLKVVGGRSSGEGLLKIYYQKMYGTICGNNWDIDTDSVVACRQLGFNRSVSPQFTVGEGSGPIHFTNFMCNGTERSITECSFQQVELYSSTCDHSRDIYVACRDPIYGNSTSSLIVVAYVLIPIVLLLAGSVVIVVVVILFLKCRSKDQDQQPRQDSSLLHHVRPDIGGQLYRNAVYSKDLPTPENLMTMFPDGHYMMSESVMGHVYESIGDDDIVRVHYKGEYHQYSLIETEEVSPIEGSPGTESTDPLTYDKLDETSKIISPYNVLTRSERRTQEGPGRHERLGLQINQEERGYNKLQRKKHEVNQLTEREDYEQIDFPDDV